MKQTGQIEKSVVSTDADAIVPQVELESTYVPDVDIREEKGVITVLADMPGVDQQSVDVTVENNVLTVEGRVRTEAPAGYELVGREYDTGRFRRDFTIADTVDTAAIKARMKNGVLEVLLPRREQAKARKIEIAG